MTDYANLDYPNNFPLKQELVRFVNLLDSNNIHYWVDFSTLTKLTATSNTKYLNYLSGFDLAVFEDSYIKVVELARNNNFIVWNSNEIITVLANPSLNLLKSVEQRFSSKEVTVQSMLKWIIIWNYKFIDNNQVHLNIKKDFTYDKSLFENIQEVEHCGIKLKIPKNINELNKIRFSTSDKVIWNHSPRKREDRETNFGFCNIGEYK